jgi:hypothetical protein
MAGYEGDLTAGLLEGVLEYDDSKGSVENVDLLGPEVDSGRSKKVGIDELDDDLDIKGCLDEDLLIELGSVSLIDEVLGFEKEL